MHGTLHALHAGLLALGFLYRQHSQALPAELTWTLLRISWSFLSFPAVK